MDDKRIEEIKKLKEQAIIQNSILRRMRVAWDVFLFVIIVCVVVFMLSGCQDLSELGFSVDFPQPAPVQCEGDFAIDFCGMTDECDPMHAGACDIEFVATHAGCNAAAHELYDCTSLHGCGGGPCLENGYFEDYWTACRL